MGTSISNFSSLLPLGALLALLALLLPGCGDRGVKPGLAPEEIVAQRAQAWVDNLMAGEVEEAWAMTSPNFRQAYTVRQYYPFIMGVGSWTSAEVDRVHCEEEVCDVRMMVEYEIRRMRISNRRPIDYKWVLVDGEWWLHVPAK